MERRRAGRPRKDRALDLALLPHGGLRASVERLIAREWTNAQILDWLEREAGVRICEDTLRNYRRQWAASSYREEVMV